MRRRRNAWVGFGLSVAIASIAERYVRVEQAASDRRYPFPHDADASLIGILVCALIAAALCAAVAAVFASIIFIRTPAPRKFRTYIECAVLVAPFAASCFIAFRT
jgi:hypothetical protein